MSAVLAHATQAAHTTMEHHAVRLHSEPVMLQRARGSQAPPLGTLCTRGPPEGLQHCSPCARHMRYVLHAAISPAWSLSLSGRAHTLAPAPMLMWGSSASHRHNVFACAINPTCRRARATTTCHTCHDGNLTHIKLGKSTADTERRLTTVADVLYQAYM